MTKPLKSKPKPPGGARRKPLGELEKRRLRLGILRTDMADRLGTSYNVLTNVEITGKGDLAESYAATLTQLERMSKRRRREWFGRPVVFFHPLGRFDRVGK